MIPYSSNTTLLRHIQKSSYPKLSGGAQDRPFIYSPDPPGICELDQLAFIILDGSRAAIRSKADPAGRARAPLTAPHRLTTSRSTSAGEAVEHSRALIQSHYFMTPAGARASHSHRAPICHRMPMAALYVRATPKGVTRHQYFTLQGIIEPGSTLPADGRSRSDSMQRLAHT